MQKIKIGHRAKFRDREHFFPQVLFPFRTPYFHFRCVARAAFDRNLIHSADVCFLVMACVGYSRAQLRTLSSHVAFYMHLRTVPTIVTAHTFCASPDTRISYRQCLPLQGYFCAV